MAAPRSEGGRRRHCARRGRWDPGYPAQARNALLPVAHTLDEALAFIGPFLNRLLVEAAGGRWHPHAAQWV